MLQELYVPAGSHEAASGKPALLAVVRNGCATATRYKMLALPAVLSSKSTQSLCSLPRQWLLPHRRQWQMTQLQGRNAPSAFRCAREGNRRLPPAGCAWRDRLCLPTWCPRLAWHGDVDGARMLPSL